MAHSDHRARPLSPHLQIYRLIPTMAMSVIHRLTGMALYAGTILLVWWLVAAASGPDYYEFVAGLAASTLGRIVMFAYSWVLIHHMLGGIRHLIWDTGKMMSRESSTTLAWLTLAGSIGLTVLIWLLAAMS